MNPLLVKNSRKFRVDLFKRVVSDLVWVGLKIILDIFFFSWLTLARPFNKCLFGRALSQELRSFGGPRALESNDIYLVLYTNTFFCTYLVKLKMFFKEKTQNGLTLYYV